ncbi:MAG: hypothetical protein ACAH95_16230 [Fimbriimonas sp.]
MSEQNSKDVGHLAGLSPSDSGQSKEELEGSSKAFSRSPTEQAIRHSDSGTTTEPGNKGFVNVDGHPVYDTIRENQPPIAHEDPERLERQRVDQEDEIVAVYDPVTGQERAELRPRISKKGAESEGL